MPHSMMKPCSYPGCSTLVAHGRCAEHPYADMHIHENQKLYNTQRWKKISANQLRKDPWCAECLRGGYYMPAVEVDHIVPHRGDPIMFYVGPFQSLCHICHARKTASEVGLSQ
jgi:5-methylcytosine-specific restriction protein A